MIYRKDVLKKLGLTDYKEYDVKSSIARVTYLMNTGVWLDDDIDLYEIMFKKFTELCPDGQYSESDWNEETRAVFKYFHMRGYFDTYAKMSLHIKNELRKRIKFNKKQWQGFDQMMKSYKDSITSAVGDLLDSEVFFHESCIYIDVLLSLLENGINVLQIYDGFFVSIGFSGDIASTVSSCATNYQHKLSHHNRDNIINNFPTINNTTTTTTINNNNNTITTTNKTINNNYYLNYTINTISNYNNNIINNITLYYYTNHINNKFISINIIINNNKIINNNNYNTITNTTTTTNNKHLYNNTYKHTYLLTVHNKLYTTIVDIFGTTGPPVSDYYPGAPP